VNRRTVSGFRARFERYHLPLLLVIGFLTRLRVFFHLDEVVISWRPTDNAGIALNFFRGGFDLLYPQILWGGNGPGYVEMEFPIVQYAAAALYKVFGVSDIVNLAIPFLSGLGIVVLVYLVARHVFDPVAGFVAAVFTAVSPPLATYCQTFQVDPTMIFFSVLGVYAFMLWTEKEQLWCYLLAAFSVSLSVLIKPTALHIGIPLIFLCHKKYGMAFLRQPLLWLFGVVALVPSLLWYWHAHDLFVHYQNTFGILDRGGLKIATIDHLISPKFYAQTAFRIFWFHVTPFASVFLLYGLTKRRLRSVTLLFHVWLASVLVYIVIVAKGVDAGHQYLLPVVVPAAVLAGVGFSALLSRLESLPLLAHTSWRIAVLVGVLAVFTLSTVMITELYRNHDFWGPTSAYPMAEKESGIAVGKVTAPGSLIIVVSSLMDDKPPEESMTPPDIFYFADRRGWYSAFSWLDIQRIEQFRAQGACYLVSSSNYASEFKIQRADLYQQLAVRFQTVMDNKNGLVIDLCQRSNRKTGS
jgi:4-amino-4-deoxy-L-arabinose transferase-like glycosyltransferase